jgi:hypothetical protein
LGASDVAVIAVRKRLLGIVRALGAGAQPPHLIMSPEQNDMRHVTCMVTKIPSVVDPKKHIAEALRKERSWEGAA